MKCARKAVAHSIFVADVDPGRKNTAKEADTLHQCHFNYSIGAFDVRGDEHLIYQL